MHADWCLACKGEAGLKSHRRRKPLSSWHMGNTYQKCEAFDKAHTGPYIRAHGESERPKFILAHPVSFSIDKNSQNRRNIKYILSKKILI